MTAGYVYAIGSEDFPFVKIGHTTNVAARLAQLQTGNPYRLEVLGTWPGTFALEQLVHQSFAFQRLRGEWFDFDGQDPVDAINGVVRLVCQAVKDTEAARKPKAPSAARMSAEDRDRQMLSLVSSRSGVSLSELARESGASKSVVTRRLDFLRNRGLVFRDTGGMWHPVS